MGAESLGKGRSFSLGACRRQVSGNSFFWLFLFFFSACWVLGMISQSNSNCLYKVTFTSSLQIGAIGKADLVLIHLFLISLDFPSRWFPAMSEGPLIGVPVLNLEILGKCLHMISPPLEEALSLLTPKEKFYFSVCSVSNFSWSVSSALVSLTVF